MGVRDVQIWLQSVVAGQPVHRDDLTRSETNGGIIHREGLSVSTLQAVPQLAKVLAAEMKMAQAAQLQNMPRMAGPSMGPGSSMGLNNLRPRAPYTQSQDDDPENKY
jgi:hypothetical protein